MISEVYDALLEAGASEEKARRAAETLANYDDRFNRLERKIDTTKSDLERKIDGFNSDLERKIDGFNSDLERKIDVTKSDLELRIEGLNGRVTLLQWQLAVLIGGVAALVVKAFA